jgi:SAM-dependent methyltransferase
MNWKTKAVMHWILSYVPLGDEIHFRIQKSITKSLPRPLYRLRNGIMHATNHVESFRRHTDKDIGSANLFEFGAGADLFVQLLLYSFGVNRQLTVDLHPLLKTELVNDSIKKIDEMKLDSPRRLPKRVLGNDTARELKEFYGIDYRAPFDARNTGLADNSVDFIISSETVQFIPKPDLIEILFECHRILKPDGLFSLSINCDDIYAYTDASISQYNFLQYSEIAWRFYSPPKLFQNRLRYKDYLSILRITGFVLLEAHPLEVTGDQLKALKTVHFDSGFKGYSSEELAIRRAHLVLRKGVKS